MSVKNDHNTNLPKSCMPLPSNSSCLPLILTCDVSQRKYQHTSAGIAKNNVSDENKITTSKCKKLDTAPPS